MRYGPQSVGGVVNFVTRAIPQDFGIEAGVESQPVPYTHLTPPTKREEEIFAGHMQLDKKKFIGIQTIYDSTCIFVTPISY
ncbi:hypothetical protein E2125_27065, partial [Escherichia coli]